jgi:hypothetical protein
MHSIFGGICRRMYVKNKDIFYASKEEEE